ncbi:MAG TPA: DUF4131 domain-containing protein, partial [Opitutus sp.]|nr:DUF4131 domain-containing protein [Opitutus sp.]
MKARRRWLAPGEPGSSWLRLGPATLALAATFEREMEQGRGFLWLPVALSVGIVIYYCLPAEPNVWALLALAVAAIAFVWRRRSSVAGFRVALVLALVIAGVLVAKLRTDWVAAPQLDREVTGVVTGWVAGAEESPGSGRRITLRVVSIAGIKPNELPRLARITIRAKAAAGLAVGDPVTMTASLGPPSGPVMPGGYDFAFVPYYEGIGATGFAYGNAHADPALGPPPLGIRLSEPLARLRD